MVGLGYLAGGAIPRTPRRPGRVNAVRILLGRLFVLGVASCCGCLARETEPKHQSSDSETLRVGPFLAHLDCLGGSTPCESSWSACLCWAWPRAAGALRGNPSQSTTRWFPKRRCSDLSSHTSTAWEGERRANPLGPLVCVGRGVVLRVLGEGNRAKAPIVGLGNLAGGAIPRTPRLPGREYAVRILLVRLFVLGVASCCGCFAREPEPKHHSLVP